MGLSHCRRWILSTQASQPAQPSLSLRSHLTSHTDDKTHTLARPRESIRQRTALVELLSRVKAKPGTSPAASGKIYPSMDAAVEARLQTVAKWPGSQTLEDASARILVSGRVGLTWVRVGGWVASHTPFLFLSVWLSAWPQTQAAPSALLHHNTHPTPPPTSHSRNQHQTRCGAVLAPLMTPTVGTCPWTRTRTPSPSASAMTSGASVRACVRLTERSSPA
jgi:hypothetical protein